MSSNILYRPTKPQRSYCWLLGKLLFLFYTEVYTRNLQALLSSITIHEPSSPLTVAMTCWSRSFVLARQNKMFPLTAKSWCQQAKHSHRENSVFQGQPIFHTFPLAWACFAYEWDVHVSSVQLPPGIIRVVRTQLPHHGYSSSESYIPGGGFSLLVRVGPCRSFVRTDLHTKLE